MAPGQGKLHNSIARSLGVAILAGQYQPGDTLDNEIDASEKLGVSRSAYREAMRVLSAKGFVESRPKTGTRVSARSRWSMLDVDVLSWVFASEPSEEFVQSLFELRLVVEPAAAAFAAERRTDAQLEQMRSALVIMQEAGLDNAVGQSADRAFHDAVLEATGNSALVTLTGSIGEAVRWTTIFKGRKGGLPPDPVPAHWLVFEEIAARRPDGARQAMERLVTSALEDTKAVIAPAGD